MRLYISICFLLVFSATLLSQNPHGASLKINCASCHSPQGWEISEEFWRNNDPEKPKISKTTGLPLPTDTLRFSHNKSTNFPLTGRHATVDCRACHETLVFSEAQSDCISCHVDVHQQTAGNDCTRCHTTDHWLVDNIQEIHFNEGFPLTGVHAAVSCEECHVSETALRFGRNGNDCASCHMDDFVATTNPDHEQAGFSTNCIECHRVDGNGGWDADDIEHSFFPLTKGHEIADCAKCHTGGDFSNTPTNCAACHLADFQAAVNPNHAGAGFSNDCASCHTTDLDWMPAKFAQHDAVFPIYSGKHEGEWTSCTDCHLAGDYNQFTCTTCHANPETDDAHDNVNGYVYQDNACLACHPTGDAEDSFNHDATGFPLTGAHLGAACLDCHANGYAGTPTDCAACHSADFNLATNPNHSVLGLPTDCASCHTTDPGWSPAKFDIHNQFYVLNGAHAAIANDCAACHNGDYVNTPNTCVGCHSADFAAATDPNHAANQFPEDCASCHSESAWAPSSFDHDQFFPFTGAHVAVADDCASCHPGGNYTGTSSECASCHTPDFQGSTNPNHVALNLPNDCAMCHTTQPDWSPAAFPLHNDFYVLNGAHAAIANDCAACHNGNYTNTPTTCFGCHANDFNSTTDPNHVALQFSQDCATCHTENAWSPATFDHDAQYFPIYSGAHQGEWTACTDCHTNPANFAEFTCTTCHANPETDDQHASVGGYVYQNNACLACHPTGDADNVFDHNVTAFPLTGAHLGVDCLECHAGGFENTPTQCAACHATDYNAATNPNHSALGLPIDCASCHTTAPGWSPAAFPMHDNFYPLNGAHASISNDCAACHNGDYVNTPNTCNGCHASDFAAATDPNHVANQFPTDCQTCHTENAWTPSTFDHAAFYPFTGAHVAVANDCIACHANGNYAGTSSECASCHTPDFQGATNPNHVALGIPTDCEMCHMTQPGWQPATFPIHNDFHVLNGAHAAIANDCAACHNGNYVNTPNTCYACHTADYQATTNPNHQSAQFPTDCASCHGESVWTPANFDHDAQYFPIYSGGHEGEWSECIDCHSNPANYAEVVCTTCHQNPETDNQHNGVGGYVYSSPACLACHPTGDATNIFDHNSTAFPLTGAHLGVDCLECHAAGFENTPTECSACHLTDFQGSTNPNHVALALPTDCASCHTTAPGWSPASFAIHNQYYALNGAHAAIANDCAACHNGNYNNTPNTCNGCHAADYAAANDPNHAANQFPTDCATCHSESAWTPSTFDHNAVYPFTGAHIAIQNECALCHIGGNYSNTPNTCEGCHLADFNSSINPNHVALAIPTDCDMCHTTAPDWQPAAFPIHNNYYQLNGAHAAISNDCAACHNGNYNSTPNTCAGCHLTEYNSTTNPNHQQAQFSQDCATCHGESAWVPANFDHDAQYFPIYSGAHEGEWSQCLDCHTNPNNFAEFTCVTCHANPETDNIHASVGGYSYNSSACLACHPTGDGDNVFDHNSTNFPLTGAHLTAECLDCHANGYQNTPTECSACHLTDFNQSANPNHVALNIPTDCATCHTTAPGWSPATFPIHNQYYALNGAHAAIANDCATCHNGNYNNTPNTCAGCHLPEYNATTNPDHEAAQFPTTCNDCHTETAWTPANFDHNIVYPLTGAHAAIANECALCHINGNYNNTPNTCEGCHMPHFNASTNPNHVALNIPTDCDMCHTTAPDWQPATFPIHNQYYALNGAHAAIANDCATCHNGNYNNTPNTCVGCHQPEYNSATDPNHVANQFPTDCATCHTETAWTPSTFDHNAIYPLNGAHAAIANECAQCHINGNYSNTPNTCVGCHQADYNATTNPDHEAAQFPTTCNDCHTETAWVPATFDHDQFYPLTGAHLAIENECALCHINGNYNNTPNTCEGCHLPDFNASTNPNHVALGIPTDCDMCHTTAPDWQPATFPIHNQYYALNGAHAAIANDCAACHNGNYNNTPNTCVGCHQPEYNAATDPNHAANQLPTTCEDCHTETAWTPSTFTHSIYPFTGAHIAVQNECILCHVNGNYNNTPNTCEGCHLPDYNASTNPNHVSLAIPTDCDMCHTTAPDWQPATFPIHNQYWQLNGAHAAIQNDCVACHNGNYNNTPTTCFGCHQPDYNSATNPNHLANQLPTTCEDCHTETAWVPSTFDHSFYPFTGAHIPIQNECALCHIGGNYANTPTTCEGCHLPDYNASTNPNHVSLAIPTDCDMCHTTDPDWNPATFPIHNQYWQFQGAHVAIQNDCAACHNGNYNNTPNTCFGCHQSEYNSANNPNHSAAGFPTDCILCHNQNAWDPATWDHDNLYFPIYSGKHDGEWTQCVECHTIPNNFSQFNCLECHEHDDPVATAALHVDVPGYQYNSGACYACHPEGED